MKLIKQRDGVDCGVACLAMVAGVSYTRAYEALEDYLTGTGLANFDLVKAGKKLGIKMKCSRARRYADGPMPCIVTVLWNRKRWAGQRIVSGHFIVVYKGRVYCPSGEQGKTLDQYLKKNQGRVGSVIWRQS